MTTRSSFSPSLGDALPAVKVPTMMRLGLFQMGLGIMSVLTLGILNRVMISELGVPATVAATTLAMHQIVAPARVWFGQLSDSKPIFGLHRSGYVWFGAAAFCAVSFLAVQVIWQLGSVIRAANGWAWNGQTLGLTLALGGLFLLYGIALSSSSTPFAALLVDISQEHNRSKIVGVAWSLLMVGIVIGGISGGILLSQVQQSGPLLAVNVGSTLLMGSKIIETPLATLQGPINGLFMVVPLVVFALALFAIWGIEKKYSRYSNRSSFRDREDSITLKTALKVLTSNRQTGLFFLFLMVMTMGLFMQEAVLEPYGGDVFEMSIPETTQLNAFWGLGTLLGVSGTGFLVVPRLGKRNTTKLGCLGVAVSFILIICAGFSHDPVALKTAVFVFGIAAGITTTGALSLMLDLTAAETAGTFIGAWGLSQAISRAVATVAGGVVLDLGRRIFAQDVWAYGCVFGLQAIAMVLCLVILQRVNVQEFQDNARQAIAKIMEEGLD